MRVAGQLFAVILAILSMGCESSFEPFAESDLTFTIFGFLDTDADTQHIRIIPLRQVVDRGGPDPIDARVTTTDLETGETVEWHDSVTQFADSSYGHVFWAAFNAEPDHRYRVDVERSDDARTFAETHVPPRPGDPDSVYGALNESGTFAPAYWPGVTRVIDADVSYYVMRRGEIAHVFVRYTDDDMGVPNDENDSEWRIEFNYREDRDLVTEALGLQSLDDLVKLRSVEMRLATPSDDWVPPGGVWDPEVLIQPGTFSNVNGGLGWFGSVARSTVDWVPSLIALRDMNYEWVGR